MRRKDEIIERIKAVGPEPPKTEEHPEPPKTGETSGPAAAQGSGEAATGGAGNEGQTEPDAGKKKHGFFG
jgi:hypothetical protein